MLIEMDGFSITLQRKRIKNINLRIKRSGDVQVSAPVKTPIDIIHSFLQLKQPWIETHRTRIQQSAKTMPEYLRTGEKVSFQGRQYELQLHETKTNPRIELSLHQLHLFVKPDASQSHKELLLTKWYRSKIEEFLPPLLHKWQSIMGVNMVTVSIKRLKSRWGSCQPIKKHIVLNLRLIEKPLICLEYVIVHELVHLFEPSHNQRFSLLMSQYLPDWKQIKKQLT